MDILNFNLEVNMVYIVFVINKVDSFEMFLLKDNMVMFFEMFKIGMGGVL